MTMAVHDHDKAEVEFERPRVTKKHYVAVGNSGWPETFERAKLDAALTAFLKPFSTSPPELSELHRLHRLQGERRSTENWHSVKGFMARQLNISPRVIPPDMVLAFWGYYVYFLATREAN